MFNHLKALALAGVSFALLATSAEARPDLRKMSCAQAQKMVRQQGSVVFTTGKHTYSMFVSSIRYCHWGEVLATQYGPTRDAKRCPVAYECVEPHRPWLFRRDRW